MGFLFRFITGAILFPFKLVKFILADIVIFGIIGGTMSLIRSILRFLFKPLSPLQSQGVSSCSFSRMTRGETRSRPSSGCEILKKFP